MDFILKRTRGLIALLGASMLLMSGCGTSNEVSSPLGKSIGDKDLAIGKATAVGDYIEITPENVFVESKVYPPKGSMSFGYDAEDADKTYVVIAAKIKNLTSREIKVNDIANLVLEQGGSKYGGTTTLLLTEDDTNLSEYDSLPSLSEGTVYFLTKIDKDKLGDTTATFTVDDNSYKFKFNTSENTAVEKELVIGDTLKADEYAEVTVKEIKYAKEVVPPNTQSLYSYYNAKDANNTLVDVVLELKNLRSSAHLAEDFLGISAVYNDKYNYRGFIVSESADRSDINSYESIAPLSTAYVHGIIEVPKEVQNGKLKVSLYFNGENYSFMLKDAE